MNVPEALIDIAGGIALTLLISFVFKKILPRLANKTKSNLVSSQIAILIHQF